jgi:AcrR family transcriptional regulator
MNRKQKIAETALHLFAERGYDNTSTQMIARDAEVSEALIFKHFGSKEQLLNFIIKSGYKRVVEHNRGMLQEKDPLQFIHRILDFPYKLVSDEPQFWKLQYRLVDLEISMKQHERFLQPVYALLIKAFSELGYENPEKETELVLLIIDSLWKRQVVYGAEDAQSIPEFLKTKYTRKNVVV